MAAFGPTSGGAPYGPLRTDSNRAGGLMYTGPTGFGIGCTGNAPLYFGTNNTVSMTITNDGNIGIDTTNPTAKLEVAGDARIRDFLYAGKGRFADNELMLYPDSLNRVYIYGKEPGDSWTDIFFWMPPKEGYPGGRSQYVYARGFKTYTSTRTVVSAETSELLDIIEQEVNKPLFDPAAEEGPPSLGSSKDISEVAMASGILSLRFYIEINALKAEIERLRDRVSELEKR
jgi:hypothetical protein